MEHTVLSRPTLNANLVLMLWKRLGLNKQSIISVARAGWRLQPHCGNVSKPSTHVLTPPKLGALRGGPQLSSFTSIIIPIITG